MAALLEPGTSRWGWFAFSSGSFRPLSSRRPCWLPRICAGDRSCSRCTAGGVPTILFQTLYVFFGVRHVNREILHIAVTPYPTAEWTAQQLVECCAWDRWPPRFLIHDRDSRYGATFERRLRHLGIEQVRTPFRAPRANAISERWVKSARTEYLDHLFIFSESHLRRAISSYVAYFNSWRPHRSLSQRAPCDSTIFPDPSLRGQLQDYRRASTRRAASRL